ncbi:MAG: hypothetical protein IT529_16825 [Burkholderiales bacterium]|nr:hypothetical protein [Burkholderiales bacterium]
MTCARAACRAAAASAIFAALLFGVFTAAPSAAQQGAGALLSPAEVERTRAEKKAWIALNMALAPGEDERFWPLYEAYQKELAQVNLRLVRLVEAYGAHYRDNTLTDELARKLAEEALAIDEAELKLKRSYLPRLAKALSARKAARYLQLEGRVMTQVRYELAANLPLVGDVRPGIAGSGKK